MTFYYMIWLRWIGLPGSRSSDARAARILRRAVPQGVDDVEQRQAADEEDGRLDQRQPGSAVQEVANREERHPDRQASRDPADGRLSHRIAVARRLRLADPGGFADHAPARARGMDLAVELDQPLAAGRRGDVGGNHPADG